MNEIISLVDPLPPQPKEPEQEPVELNKSGIRKLLKQSGFDNSTPEETAAFISGIRHREAEILDTTPPQRTWVGLTNDERMEIYSESLTIWSCMEAVEAVCKGNNT